MRVATLVEGANVTNGPKITKVQNVTIVLKLRSKLILWHEIGTNFDRAES